jgi:hypothetical protein
VNSVLKQRTFIFQQVALSVNEMQVLLMLTVYSSKDGAFYTRHEGEINVIDMT